MTVFTKDTIKQESVCQVIASCMKSDPNLCEVKD